MQAGRLRSRGRLRGDAGWLVMGPSLTVGALLRPCPGPSVTREGACATCLVVIRPRGRSGSLAPGTAPVWPLPRPPFCGAGPAGIGLLGDPFRVLGLGGLRLLVGLGTAARPRLTGVV